MAEDNRECDNGEEGVRQRNKICFSNWGDLEEAINHSGCYWKNTCKVPLLCKSWENNNVLSAQASQGADWKGKLILQGQRGHTYRLFSCLRVCNWADKKSLILLLSSLWELLFMGKQSHAGTLAYTLKF